MTWLPATLYSYTGTCEELDVRVFQSQNVSATYIAIRCGVNATHFQVGKGIVESLLEKPWSNLW